VLRIMQQTLFLIAV